MSDFDTILNILETRKIKFTTDWNKEAMFNHDTRLIKWITIRSFNHMDKKVNLIESKFSIDGDLELVTTLPEYG